MNVSRAALALAFALALSTPSCAERSAVAPPPAAATIDLPAGWAESLPAALADELDRAARAHTVFGVGEGDHYVREKYPYRLAVLGRLVRNHGLRHVALEMGASDARRVDRYLETGDERWLDRVALYGYRGDSDDERRELGPVTRGARRAIDDAWVREERAFLRGLRGLAGGPGPGDRVRAFGFDFDAVPGGGYADARDALAACEPTPAVAALRAQLTPPRNTTGERELARLAELCAHVPALAAELEGACGARALPELTDALEQLRFSYRIFFEWRRLGTDPANLGPLRAMFVEREARMFDRFSAYQAALAEGARVAILGHDLHVAKESDRLRFGVAPHDAPMWESLGTRVERRRPGSVWVSWLLYGAGSRYHPGKAEGRSAVTLREGSLEEALAGRPGDYVALPARAEAPSLFDRALPFGTETSEGSGAVRGATDAIVFLPRASAPGER